MHTSPDKARTLDIVALLLLTVAVMTIRASGPSTTYAYAQLWQAGVSIDVATQGNWLWPSDQKGEPAHKPQMYAWLCAPVLMATGYFDDVTFRAPSIVATSLMTVLVYLLGLRWYGRRTGVLAAALWVTTLGVHKLTYQGTTDMLLTLWLTASLFCVDRLLFHRARSRRRAWAAGFWAATLLAAWTKGWGVASLPMVIFLVVVMSVCWPGFGVLRRADALSRKVGLLLRLIGRRWWQAIKRSQLIWGLPAVALVFGALLWATWSAGGKEFERIFHFEVIQRITGGGADAPKAASVPAAVHLLYYGLPVSLLAIMALVMVCPTRWFTRRGPFALPLVWVIAFVLPYSLSHGFRPDYLLPCYVGLALMGAWAVSEVARRGRVAGRGVGFLRHAIAAGPVVIGLGLIVVPAMYVYAEPLGSYVDLPLPYNPGVGVWFGMLLLIPMGAIILAGGIIASLRWKLHTVAALACVGMLGVSFINVHMISRHARTGDGAKMRSFALRAKSVIGDDDYAVLKAEKLMPELYLGRFSDHLARERPSVLALNDNDIPWLITCDRGLVELGAATESSRAPFKMEMAGVDRRYATHPAQFGLVVLTGGMVEEDEWGRIYLIRLRRPLELPPKRPGN